MAETSDYKKTLNLPQTAFAMKANLPQNEPKILARWEEMGIYERIQQARKGLPPYVLHDGPPYANGALHLGHALNKCLKDFIVKSKSMWSQFWSQLCPFGVVLVDPAHDCRRSARLIWRWSGA